MLQLARDLKVTAPIDEHPAVEPSSPGAAAETARHAPTGAARLSEREREVAELLVLGFRGEDVGVGARVSRRSSILKSSAVWKGSQGRLRRGRP